MKIERPLIIQSYQDWGRWSLFWDDLKILFFTFLFETFNIESGRYKSMIMIDNKIKFILDIIKHALEGSGVFELPRTEELKAVNHC